MSTLVIPRETPEGYLVLCPVCCEEVLLDIDHWHTDCGNPIITKRLRENSQLKWEERNYPAVSWTVSKNDNLYARAFGYVLLVIADKRNPGKYSCGAFSDGEESGKPILRWKGGFSTEKSAQNDIEKRMNQHKGFKEAKNEN